MPLSVANSHGGGGMSNLLRQTRPVRSGDAAGASSNAEPTAALRPLGRAAIDSTGAKTAQIKATLTVVMSRLGQAGETAVDKPRATSLPGAGQRSGASDVLRVLDAYAADPLRLSA